MDKLVIEGGRPLKGTVKISGSKNSALPLMAACLLTDEKVELSNVPHLRDISTMNRLLVGLGVKTSFLWEKLAIADSLTLHAKKITNHEAPYELVRTMRASILVLGPLLARARQARVSLPGGCAIGARPVNLHIKALEEMGAKIKLDAGYIEASCKKLKGATILFDQVTVTGTENIMMAAALAEGTTVIENAAREPEITDLADLLREMGAQIAGDGTSVITIRGVERLHGTSHRVIPDRIEAGTFMIAAAMTRGDVRVDNMYPSHVDALSQKLREAGAVIIPDGTWVHIKGPKDIKPVDAVTAPYPGFATDFQAQFMAMMAIAEGASVITETIFENRFMHVLELTRMGADLHVDGNSVHVKGVGKLQSAPVMATDLRASASLLLAALAAKGVTDIHRVYHIDRGYEGIEKKMRKLGARVKRAKVTY
jgi:UDP-N-acetylglucosamine 1-carboxyvinyltransferase